MHYSARNNRERAAMPANDGEVCKFSSETYINEIAAMFSRTGCQKP